jgi:hypothetical protein
MTSKRNYILSISVCAALAFTMACGGATTGSNSNNSNANASKADTNRDMSPVTVSAGDLSEKEHKGRTVTITDLRLASITPSKLELVTPSGAGRVSCIGEFSSYMESSKRVEELVSKGISNAPKATIKGVYKQGSRLDTVTVEPCGLTDLEK